MSERVAIEIKETFDHASARVVDTPRPHVLLTWDVEPDPIDAGAPETIQAVLAGALLTFGAMLFLDTEPPRGADVRATLTLRRGWWDILPRRSPLVRADTMETARRAFDATGHSWAQAAQWIVVVERDAAVDEAVAGFVERLHVDWAVPEVWPEPVRLLVEAGNDGDMASLIGRDEAALAALGAAVEERMPATA